MRKARRRVTLHKYPAIHHSDEDIVVRIKADAPVLLPDEPVPALISSRKSVSGALASRHYWLGIPVDFRAELIVCP